MRVVTHPRVLQRPWSAQKAWAYVAALLDSPGLGVLVATLRHRDVAEQVLAELPSLAGNILHDAHTAILMREHGVRRICTRDVDFHRFPFVEVVEP
jgi:predicted nucleic acid-binding protein